MILLVFGTVSSEEEEEAHGSGSSVHGTSCPAFFIHSFQLVYFSYTTSSLWISEASFQLALTSRSLLTSLCHFVGEGNGCSIYACKISHGVDFVVCG